MSSVEQIEAYVSALEEFLSSSLTSVAPDLPHINEIAHRIWADITRFGPPSLPQLPGLGVFEVPPPPPLPPLPPPLTWAESLADWAGENKWTVASLSIGVAGAGVLAGYGVVKYRQISAANSRRTDLGKERREVVVVLGADHSAGPHLVLSLEAQGYIVIASVATPEAAENLNMDNRSKGYVRVLVFDPREPNSTPVFLRSLQSSLCLRFPTNAAGDPYVPSSTSPLSRPYIHSLISLLSLFPGPSPTPLESVSLMDSYLPHLTRTHIAPLRVIQSLLPLLRRTSRFPGEGTTRKSIIVCVPAMSARVGVAFAGEEAMSAAGTIRAVDILRRELNASQSASEGVSAPKIVLVDVGSLALSRHRTPTPPAYDPPALMQTWSPSEKAAYGAALEGALRQARVAPRKPVHVGVFVDSLVGVVSGGSRGRGYGYGHKSEWRWGTVWRWMLGRWGRVRTWTRGERFSVGAGATTYSFASYLPPFVLDYLLNIPYVIASIRTSLLPIPQYVPPPAPVAPSIQPLPRLIENAKPPLRERDHDLESSDAASEPDSASVSASESGAVGGGWVSLKDSVRSDAESSKE